MTKISFGCTRDFRVKMWGTSLREDKLADDLGNAIEATSIVGRRSDFLQRENLAQGNLGLLQQYLPQTDIAPYSSPPCATVISLRQVNSLELESNRYGQVHALPPQFRRRRREGLRAAQERQRLFVKCA